MMMMINGPERKGQDTVRERDKSPGGGEVQMNFKRLKTYKASRRKKFNKKAQRL
jgi:hypothetical protein